MGSAGPALAGAQVVGGAISAYGAEQEGKSQERYYNFLARQAEQSANYAIQAGETGAVSADRAAGKALEEVRRGTRQARGAQIAALAANNIGAGSVTAEDIATQTVDVGKLDEAAVRYNADLAIYQAKTGAALKAWELRTEAAGYRAAGKNARAVGRLNAYTSLLGGATQGGSTYASFAGSQKTAGVAAGA